MWSLQVILLLLTLTFSSADVQEPASQIFFKNTLKLPGASSNHQLLGTGVRVKNIVGPVKVQVYAVGIYGDAGRAAAELSAHRCEDDNSIHAQLYNQNRTLAEQSASRRSNNINKHQDCIYCA